MFSGKPITAKISSGKIRGSGSIWNSRFVYITDAKYDDIVKLIQETKEKQNAARIEQNNKIAVQKNEIWEKYKHVWANASWELLGGREVRQLKLSSPSNCPKIYAVLLVQIRYKNDYYHYDICGFLQSKLYNNNHGTSFSCSPDTHVKEEAEKELLYRISQCMR